MKAEKQQKEVTSRVIQPSKSGGGHIVDNRSTYTLQTKLIDAIQQNRIEKEICMGKRYSNIIQLRCNPQQLAWQANYVASGLGLNDLFTNSDLVSYADDQNFVENTVDRGTFAHEYIQGANSSWTAEYGIPPTGGYSGWSYADMVKNGDIYEIKPLGGMEDAVTQATNYVNKANANPSRPHVHKLASVAIQENPCSLNKTIGQKTYSVKLSYGKHADGEILYSWSVTSRALVGNKKKMAIASQGSKPIDSYFSPKKGPIGSGL